MKEMKGIAPAPKKLFVDGTDGSRRNHNGEKIAGKAPSFQYPKIELEAAIQRYVDLHELAPIGYITFDRVGRIEEINLAAVQLLGRPRHRLVGSPFAMFVAKADSQLFLHHLLRCRLAEHRIETELHLKTPSGGTVPVQLSSVPIHSLMKDGALLYQTAIVDLTERKRAEDSIRQSEVRYRTLFDLVPVAVYTCDARGLIQEFNQRAVELWGREPKKNNPKERFCGSFKMFFPDGRSMPHEKCPMARVLRSETVKAGDLEILVEQANGTRRNVIVNPMALRDGRGKVTGAINCLHDITGRKRTEQSLAEAARQQEVLYQFVKRRHEAKSLNDIYAAALDAILAALHCDRASILLFDDKGVMRFVDWRGLSDEYRRVVEGHSPWKRNAKDPQPICIADIGVADIPKSLKSTIKAEGIRAAAFIPLRAEGKLIGKFMTYYDAPHVFTDKELSLALTIAGQLALGVERKRAEEALRESEQRYRAIVSQSIAGMARTDREGKLIFVNRKFCEMLGYKEVELTGKTIKEITHPDDVAESARLLRRIMRQGLPYQLEKRYLRKDGSTLWVSVSASPVLDVSGKTQSAVAVIIDIADRRKVRAELEAARNFLELRVREQTGELRVANKELKKEIKRRQGLEGQILEVSDREQQRLGEELHDGICQHLTAVSFMARAVALRLRDHRVFQVEDIEKIAELVNAAAADVRNLARGLHRIDVDAVGLVTALRNLVDREIWKTPCRLKIKGPFHIEDDEAAVHLYRIAREAVINAAKHARAREIVIQLSRARTGIRLSVSDDGIGMPKKLDRSKGMGFHIMSHRARSAGGRLEVESAKQGGTRVTCYLPKPK
jgi:PAS domain S-box-containing protein